MSKESAGPGSLGWRFVRVGCSLGWRFARVGCLQLGGSLESLGAILGVSWGPYWSQDTSGSLQAGSSWHEDAQNGLHEPPRTSNMIQDGFQMGSK